MKIVCSTKDGRFYKMSDLEAKRTVESGAAAYAPKRKWKAQQRREKSNGQS